MTDAELAERFALNGTDTDPEPDTFTSGGMTAGEAWARWRAAAGIFGGTVPLYLPDAVPSALPDIAAAAARAVAAADDASGPGSMPVVGLDVELKPGSIRLSYGGGRTRAWVQIRLGVSDEASAWGVDVNTSYNDLSGVDESVVRRVEAGVAVEWAYRGRWS